MPAGAPNYSTAALSNVVINYAGVIPISASNLVAGANVLAVEVHQATGSPDGPVIGMEMTYSQSPVPPVTLAFNEFNGTTNTRHSRNGSFSGSGRGRRADPAAGRGVGHGQVVTARSLHV